MIGALKSCGSVIEGVRDASVRLRFGCQRSSDVAFHGWILPSIGGTHIRGWQEFPLILAIHPIASKSPP